jgi:hydrogenase expression/formation protein HypC
MCLGVPMQVIAISADLAVCDIDGVRRAASLMMLAGVEVGDYVLVHAGFAIEKIDEAEAHLTLQLLRDALDEGWPAG